MQRVIPRVIISVKVEVYNLTLSLRRRVVLIRTPFFLFFIFKMYLIHSSTASAIHVHFFELLGAHTDCAGTVLSHFDFLVVSPCGCLSTTIFWSDDSLTGVSAFTL